ncbi:hypothetical protein LAZ67_4001799 [Cordylochernes scorpioides]|uniref:Uncharacterized protein n=1 Tax=Cordylochernes scorpioides TaxID=51811 RepID=A0ABY6KFN7_9ARAC|nr:hypothetical protein LAZ67_4001799 [Cordylochernes scorpioides]
MVLSTLLMCGWSHTTVAHLLVLSTLLMCGWSHTTVAHLMELSTLLMCGWSHTTVAHLMVLSTLLMCGWSHTTVAHLMVLSTLLMCGWSHTTVAHLMELSTLLMCGWSHTTVAHLHELSKINQIFGTMDHFKPSSQFELTTNNAEAWETWKFEFLLYSDAIQLETKPVKQQRAILLHNIGDVALNIYKTFGLQETLTNPTITEILEKFDNHFKPFKNVIYRIYNFFSEVQEKNQSFDDFVTKVKNKALDCDFGDLTESLIRDRIVLGVLDKN